MAWIQHILFWVTVMSTSAYNYKHRPNFAPQSQYYELYQESSHQQTVDRQRDTQANQTNERYLLVNSPTAQYVNNDQRRSTVQETTPRIENGSYRVLNNFPKRYPTITNRRGQIEEASQDRVVFPGPISRKQYEPEVPEECKRIGICEEIPNYPEDHVASIIANLGVEMKKFQIDELDKPDTPDIAQRLGRPEDTMELCGFRERIVYPRAAPDKNGKWYTVINLNDNPLQGFKVEICDTAKPSCADFVSFQPGYEAKCVQKFVRRTMAVVDGDGNMTDMALKLPSCCSCVANLKL